MYITNVTDYDNMTDDYRDSLSMNINCTMNGNNIDTSIPTLLLAIPCVLIILYLLNLMAYTLIKPLIRNK